MVEISVVIPVYNTENYLKECLDSICNQTFDDIEIICINDGSTDNSLEILNEYERMDDRISVFSQDNSGQSVARNNGVKLAKGKYVYFMDSDDYLELTALEELHNICEEKDLDLLIFKLINFNNNDVEKYTSDYYEMNSLRYLNGKVFNLHDIGEKALDFAVSPPGKLFKRELIKDIKFPENLIFEDNLFFAKAMINANRVSFLDKHLYYRRIHQDSTTKANYAKFSDSITIINKIIDLSKENSLYEEFKYGLAKKKIDLALIRYHDVSQEYKEEFFKKVNDDLKHFQNEYEDIILPSLDDRYNHIFRSFITSNNHDEFDLNMDIFELKNDSKKLYEENKDLIKNINILKNINKDIISSNSWKITKPLRFFSKLFK